MKNLLSLVSKKIYTPIGYHISNYQSELESKAYDACQFNLESKQIHGRTAKITPKKIGQFVTFWKRSPSGPITPFHEADEIDFLIVNIKANHKVGQFVFPKAVLVKKGIVSTVKKEGKRAFRVYPPWDTATSRQAKNSQKWQSVYFYELNDQLDLEKVKLLYVN